MALADAVIALTARKAVRNSKTPSIGYGFIQFQPEWFDVESDGVPEAASPEDAKESFRIESKNLGLI
jgi:hypothetical protein